MTDASSDTSIVTRGDGLAQGMISTMRIAELFVSRQGEGRLAGQTSLFIRTSGCNLRCWFCDTPYASWQPEGFAVSVDQLVERASSSGVDHVVITGGEPMLAREIVALTWALQRLGTHVTIETAGTVARSVACDLMSVSPKLANSRPRTAAPKWVTRHEATRNNAAVIERLASQYDCQFKFVIDGPQDLGEVDQYLDQHSYIDAGRVWLMPQGVTAEELASRAAWLQPYCERRGFQFCPRKHIEWYGHQRGT
jgi:7-carboxy-7-deazaguanine synthase